jgi:signal transduction histidine kinase
MAWRPVAITQHHGGVTATPSGTASARAVALGARDSLRALFVLVGAALALGLGVTAFTLLALAAGAGTPVWVVALIGIVIVGGPLSVGVLPAVRQVEGVAAQTLLGVRFGDGPPGPAVGWTQRRRTLGWFLLHVGTGAALVAAVIADVGLAGSWWTAPAVVATLLAVVVAGRWLAALAPVLLGPSYAERLAAVAARARERNRIARELHDSIGHALSLVTVQTAAARRVIGDDAGFAEQALETIHSTARRAVADLDHMLGLLRDDPRRPAPATPVPDLGSLDELIDAARSAGLTVSVSTSGALPELPVLVSQEAYRIVQEGLTNALKYSTDAAVTLRLRLDGAVLAIALANAAPPRRSQRGRGLHGIEERAATLGGTARAGSQDGRWTLSVTLPAGTARP